IILGVAQNLKETLSGMVNLVTGPPPPEGTVSPFGAATQASIEQQTGQPFVTTEAQMRENRQAAAFVASSLVGGVAATTILGKMAPGVIKTALAGTAAGAAFGAI